MKVVLLLLLPLLALAAKKTQNKVLGGKCGKKNANPNIICEASTSCQQWPTKKRHWFCLQEACINKGDYTNEGKLKLGLCCDGLKSKKSKCVQESDEETPDNNSEEEQVPTSYNEEFCTKNQDHTMCSYNGKGSACSAVDKESEFGFTEAGKKLIVDKHNELRSRVAQGKEDRSSVVGGQPQATNMRAVRWSEELAVVAQKWADQCTFGHDKDRKKLDGTYVGQNTFIGMANKKTQDEVMATMGDPVEFWFNEVSDFDPENIKPFENSKFGSPPTGHYTQVAWADTEEVGCGWSYYLQDGYWKSLVQCNYAIGGNMAGSAMYKVGEPCSSCPVDYTCNSEKLCEAPAE